MKKFDIPEQYHSGIIAKVKTKRKLMDPRKQDFSPSSLDFGKVTFLLPRHFGFCYGVENAIEISYKAIKENTDKRIFLLSQMIHNPAVNEDLQSLGIRFIMDTKGNQFIDWSELQPGDIVIIPAFGTTIEIETILRERGVEMAKYNTTCPFVERVWKRSAEIGTKGYTIIIHGKHQHEETRATFSRSLQNAPSVVIRDMEEAELLAKFIRKELPSESFYKLFDKKYSAGFDPEKHLNRVGVVNQTTMLATETQAIADYFKLVMEGMYDDKYKDHFADTRDTLCYATNDNQQATLSVLDKGADFALVIGGYNSSNTSQIVTILASEMPVYFISDASEIVSEHEINHFNYNSQKRTTTMGWLPTKERVKIVLTSGASCPDTILEAVMERVLSFQSDVTPIETVLANL